MPYTLDDWRRLLAEAKALGNRTLWIEARAELALRGVRVDDEPPPEFEAKAGEGCTGAMTGKRAGL